MPPGLDHPGGEGEGKLNDAGPRRDGLQHSTPIRCKSHRPGPAIERDFDRVPETDTVEMFDPEEAARLTGDELFDYLDRVAATIPADVALAHDRAWRRTMRLLRRWRASPAPTSLPLAYLPPVTAEARYSRSRGRYGRHRGGEDPDGSLKCKAPQLEAGALHKGTVGNDRRNSGTRRIPDRPPHNQAPDLPRGLPAVACSRAPATQTEGDATS